MARLLPLFLCLATLTAFSGCADDGGDAEADGGEASVPIVPPEADGAAVVDGPETPVGPEEPAVATCEVIVNAGAGIAGNFQSAYLACPFSKADGQPQDYGWALVEASWPDALPTSTEFYLYLLSDSCNFSGAVDPCWHALQSSATPMVRLAADAALLDEAGDDGLLAWTGMDGVAVQQRVVLAITLVPEGYVLAADYSGLP